MSALTSTPAMTTGAASVTVKNKIGLGLSALLGLADIASPFTIPAPKAGESGPPMSILIICAVLGVITIAAVVFAWRTGDRIGSRVVAGSRVLSALTTLPAFIGHGVPAGLVAIAGIQVALTLLAVYLVLTRPIRL